MNSKQKFENFLESLKGHENDALIESVKMGFRACCEGVNVDGKVKSSNDPDIEYVYTAQLEESIINFMDTVPEFRDSIIKQFKEKFNTEFEEEIGVEIEIGVDDTNVKHQAAERDTGTEKGSWMEYYNITYTKYIFVDYADETNRRMTVNVPDNILGKIPILDEFTVDATNDLKEKMDKIAEGQYQADTEENTLNRDISNYEDQMDRGY